MSVALRIRRFLIELLRSSYASGLERELADLKLRQVAELNRIQLDHATSEAKIENTLAETAKLVDYFRARADRLELLLLPNPVPRVQRAAQTASPPKPKTWAEVQKEWAEKLAAERAEEAKKKTQLGEPSN